MSKKLIITVLSIGLIALISYYLLGGFNKATYTVETKDTIEVYGVYYEGKIGSDTLREYFTQARTLVEENEQIEDIVIVYYGDVNPNNGQVRNFIGVNSNGNELNTFEGWSNRAVKSEASVKACIEANPLAMPTPEDMLSELKEMALQKRLKPDTVFIEYYSGPNNLCVELLTQ